MLLLSGLLYILFIGTSLATGLLLLHKKYHRNQEWWHKLYQPLPIVTLIVAGIHLLFILWQTTQPSLYFALQRDGGQLASGEWWRILTPIFVHDGGLLGAGLSLLILLVLGAVVEKLMRRRSWLLLYFGTAFLSETLAYALIYQNGAGNSLAYFGLATATLAAGLGSKRRRIQYLSITGLGVGVGLVLISDIHGLAFVTGGIIASLIMLWPKHFHGR